MLARHDANRAEIKELEIATQQGDGSEGISRPADPAQTRHSLATRVHLRDINFSTVPPNFSTFRNVLFGALSGSEQATERFLSVLDHSICAYNCAAHMNLKFKTLT